MDGAEIVKRYGTEDYDAIISRGGTAQLIQTLTEIPVISIRLSVYDVFWRARVWVTTSLTTIL